jgi:hypothetical protein
MGNKYPNFSLEKLINEIGEFVQGFDFKKLFVELKNPENPDNSSLKELIIFLIGLNKEFNITPAFQPA